MQSEPIISQYQDLVMDVVKRTVTRDGQDIMLTQKEFDLLYELMKKPEEVFTRDELLNTVWGYDYIGQTNTVDVFVRALRNKLDDEQHPRLIQTVRGVGYVLRAADEK